MALFGTATLDDFRNKQSTGVFGFDMGAEVESSPAKQILENPNVDPVLKSVANSPNFKIGSNGRNQITQQILDSTITAVREKDKVEKARTAEIAAEASRSALVTKYSAMKDFAATGKLPESNTQPLHIPYKAGVIDPKRDNSYNLNRLKQSLADKESYGGDYGLLSKVSSATGKYQFLWGTWGEKIAKQTGVTSRQAFANNPKAQEKFFEWYLDKEINPAARKLQSQAAKQGVPFEDVVKLVHFRGAGGTRSLLNKGVSTWDYRDSKNNMAPNEYLNKGKWAPKAKKKSK